MDQEGHTCSHSPYKYYGQCILNIFFFKQQTGDQDINIEINDRDLHQKGADQQYVKKAIPDLV